MNLRGLFPDVQPARQRLIEMARDEVTPGTAQEQDDRAECEQSLKNFTLGAWHVLEPANPFQDGWIVDCLVEHLEALWRGDILKLILNLPPRHMKSQLLSVLFFCWGWAKRPEERFIYASNIDNLAYRDADRSMDLIRSDWYQSRWRHKFRLTREAFNRIKNNRQGHRISTSIRGRGLGEGAGYLIADDPAKPNDIHLKSARDAVTNWWINTMQARGNDPLKTRKVICHQRLHEGDLSGYQMAKDIGYECLVLPARWEPNRIFVDMAEAKAAKVRSPIIMTKLQREIPRLRDPRTIPGEPLWPERFPDLALRELEREFLSQGIAGQMQQRPAPDTGDIFRRENFKYAQVVDNELVLGEDEIGVMATRIPLKRLKFFQTIDTALEVNAAAKYTVILTNAIAPEIDDRGVVRKRHLITWSMFRERLEVPEQMPAIKELRKWEASWDAPHKLWTPGKKWPNDLILQAIEPKASGIGLIQAAAAEGFPLYPLKGPAFKGGESKVPRATAVAGLYQGGLVWHLKSMRGLGTFEEELLNFPTGQYNDAVDCQSYAGILFNYERLLTANFDGIHPMILDQHREQEHRERNTIKIGGGSADGGYEIYVNDDD